MVTCSQYLPGGSNSYSPIFTSTKAELSPQHKVSLRSPWCPCSLGCSEPPGLAEDRLDFESLDQAEHRLWESILEKDLCGSTIVNRFFRESFTESVEETAPEKCLEGMAWGGSRLSRMLGLTSTKSLCAISSRLRQAGRRSGPAVEHQVILLWLWTQHNAFFSLAYFTCWNGTEYPLHISMPTLFLSTQ